MPQTTITTADEIYLVSADDPVPSDGRFRAFVVGQALDSVTKQPLRVAVRVVVDEPGFTVEAKDQNWFVVAGILRKQFPMLAIQPYNVHLTLSAPGYQPLQVIAKVPQTLAGTSPKVVEVKPADTEMLLEP